MNSLKHFFPYEGNFCWTMTVMIKCNGNLCPKIFHLSIEGDFLTRILLEPIGVVGAITPWNYPLLMGIWKVHMKVAESRDERRWDVDK